MDPDDRFLAVAALQAALLGALAGLAAEVTLFVPMDTTHSGPAAVAAAWLVRLLFVLVGGALLVALALPGAADRARDAADRSRWIELASTAAVAVLHVGLAAAFLLVALAMAIGGSTLLSGVAALCAVGVLVLGVVRLTGRRPLGDRETPFTTGRVAVLVVTFAVVFVGAPALAGSADEVVHYGVEAPEAGFTAEYEAVDDDRGVLTVTHAGGEPVDPASLAVAYRGVDGASHDAVDADQYEPGRWAGETTGPPIDGSSASVVEGDSVRVAVRSDCHVHVLYREGRDLAILETFECPDHEANTPATPAS